MNPISLRLPEDTVVLFNALYPSKDPDLLTQDLLAVKLAGGKVIDVSWWPEHDPHGQFYVTVYEHEWRNRLACVTRTDPSKAAEAVQNLASVHSQSIGFVPASTSTHCEFPQAVHS